MQATLLQTAMGMDNTANLFNGALCTANSRKVVAFFTHRQTCLKDMSQLKSQRRGNRYMGRKDVALDDIRGTEGRTADFDDKFYPRTDRIRQRWQSVARAMEQGISLPPVELILVGKTYYVRDGHHRISVTRALGYKTILAEVTAWDEITV
jgi:hypothetical protein